MIPNLPIQPLTHEITCRPVYDSRRSLRQKWGVFANGILTVITLRYPSQLMRDLRRVTCP